jgi:hypothetical protein
LQNAYSDVRIDRVRGEEDGSKARYGERLAGSDCKAKWRISAHVVFSDAQEPTGNTMFWQSSSRNVKSIVSGRGSPPFPPGQYGIDLDYHIISVAPITPEMLMGGNIRLTLQRHHACVPPARKWKSPLRFSRGEDRFVGTAVGSAIPFFQNERCIAQATLDAVKRCNGSARILSWRIRKTVHPTAGLSLFRRLYCLPELTPLVGCVFTEPDPDAAVAQSVLDAINRKLAIYSQEV